MSNMSEELNSFRDFVIYLVRGYFVGTCKSVLQMTDGRVCNMWYNDVPLPDMLCNETFTRYKYFLDMPVARDSWMALQLEQKKVRLVQYFSNGGVDPYPDSDFLQPWLLLAGDLQEPPLLLFQRMMDHAIVVIDNIKDEIIKGGPTTLRTRTTLRNFVKEVTLKHYGSVPGRHPVATITGKKLVEMISRHPIWKGTVRIPSSVPISAVEIGEICRAVCKEEHTTRLTSGTVEEGEGKGEKEGKDQGGAVDFYIDGKTGEVVEKDHPNARKFASVGVAFSK